MQGGEELGGVPQVQQTVPPELQLRTTMGYWFTGPSRALHRGLGSMVGSSMSFAPAPWSVYLSGSPLLVVLGPCRRLCLQASALYDKMCTPQCPQQAICLEVPCTSDLQPWGLVGFPISVVESTLQIFLVLPKIPCDCHQWWQ